MPLRVGTPPPSRRVLQSSVVWSRHVVATRRHPRLAVQPLSPPEATSPPPRPPRIWSGVAQPPANDAHLVLARAALAPPPRAHTAGRLPRMLHAIPHTCW